MTAPVSTPARFIGFTVITLACKIAMRVLKNHDALPQRNRLPFY
jgi:hypothetical protein